MTTPILAAIDRSSRAPGVIAAAVRLARTFDTSVVLCRVVPAFAFPLAPEAMAVGADIMPPVGQPLDAVAQRELDELAAQLPREVHARGHTVIGVPWRGICETAAHFDASLIVIGSHGYGAFDRLLGTTAAKVVNHADRSVLVVRGGWLS